MPGTEALYPSPTLINVSDTSASNSTPLTAYDAITQHVNATISTTDAIVSATESAQEFGIAVPDALTGTVLTSLMQLAAARRSTSPAAVIASPASAVVGLYLLAALDDGGVLTCIDPEIEHQSLAKKAFRDAGIRANRQRFLPSHPREVLGRLAPGAYDLVYLDVAPLDLIAVQEQAWPLLRPGGVLVMAGALLDGTIEDTSRNDRDTQAAREADQHFLAIEDATIMRLPIAAGMTILLKK